MLLVGSLKLKYWEKNVSQCHFVHHKSYLDWSGIEWLSVGFSAQALRLKKVFYP
jgi:hypothetical protein